MIRIMAWDDDGHAAPCMRLARYEFETLSEAVEAIAAMREKGDEERVWAEGEERGAWVSDMSPAGIYYRVEARRTHTDEWTAAGLGEKNRVNGLRGAARWIEGLRELGIPYANAKYSLVPCNGEGHRIFLWL